MKPKPELKPCVFFDRDGIVNRSPGPGYVERWEDFHLIPAFIDAVRVVNERNHATIIVTNQRGVSLGRMTQQALDTIHDNLVQRLGEFNVHLDDVIYCVELDDAHPNRKPNPGMLIEGANRHHIDLAHSWMVGDHERDVTAGRRAGCRTVLVHKDPVETQADYRLDSMDEVPDFLRAHLKG
ncbi:MAG: HAD-IIIA family hydrolase [bacterium]